MARRRLYRPVVLLRRVLLGFLVVVVGAVGAFYLLGRSQPRGGAPAPRQPAALDLARDQVLSGEGFDYEVTDGERVALRVRADRIIGTRQDLMELENLRIDVPDEGVHVEGDRGIYRLRSNEARLEGSVRAWDDDGMVVRGDGFELADDGDELVSTSGVRFSLRDEYEGRADELQYHLKRKRLTLAGDVLFRSLEGEGEGTEVRTRRLVFERLERVLRVEGRVRLQRGREFVRASRASVTLEADRDRVRFVRASKNVEGSLLPGPRSSDPGTTVRFTGRLLYALVDGETERVERVELEGGKDSATLEAVDASGLVRRLEAPLLVAHFAAGELERAEAMPPARIEEFLEVAPRTLLRRVCAESLEAVFTGSSELDKITLEGRVDYQEPGVQASGDRVVAQARGERLRLEGAPASIVTDRGLLRAPRIDYAGAKRVAVAQDGVRAELAAGGRLGLAGGDERQPLMVTAREARWSDDPSTVRFTGEVRAWQGADFLLADELVGEPEAQRLVATGKVRTVVTPRGGEGPLGERAAPGDAKGGERAAPVEITAERLDYDRGTRTVTYTGKIRVHQEGRSLRCDDLDVVLAAADDEFERMVCSGNLRLDDPVDGRTVTGAKGVYDPAAKTVEVTGDPVEMTDRQGTRLRGTSLVYDLEAGTARMLTSVGAAPEPGP